MCSCAGNGQDAHDVRPNKAQGFRPQAEVRDATALDEVFDVALGDAEASGHFGLVQDLGAVGEDDHARLLTGGGGGGFGFTTGPGVGAVRSHTPTLSNRAPKPAFDDGENFRDLSSKMISACQNDSKRRPLHRFRQISRNFIALKEL